MNTPAPALSAGVFQHVYTQVVCTASKYADLSTINYAQWSASG